jgi:serine/threonine protein kinase
VDYEPIARLGRGGMGVVDLARDRNGNRVALKRLTLTGSAGEVLRARQRLLREAEVLRRLHHPNVVGLLDVVEEGDDIVLVMPYLSGGNLAERVGQHGPAPPDEIDRLAQRLLSALAEAHALGVIHRDVKPGNVLYDDQAEPYLADFGLAHTWDQTHGLTVVGMVVGTPGFMPPEQARDEPLTPASDIFAVGATLLFAATAVGPFGTGDPGLLMVRAASGKVEKVPKSLPKPLRKRLSAMLDPRPERRPTAAQLLAGYEAGRAARWAGPAVSHTRSHPGAALAVGAACVVIVAGAYVVTRDDTSNRDPAGDFDSSSDDGTSAPPKTEGDDKGPDGSGSNVVESPILVDRVDATLSATETAHAYTLPEDPVRCAQRIEVTLTLTGTGAQPLRVQLRQDGGGAPLAEAIAVPGQPAVVALPPGLVCDGDDNVQVTVSPATPLAEDVPYALERFDSY